MAIELKQQLKLTQQLVMTPQLQQAIKLLQLSRLELVDAIRQELEENPALEEVQESTEEAEAGPAESEPAPETAPAEKEVTIEEKFTEEVDWSNYLDEYNAPGRVNYESEEKETPQYEAFISQNKSLSDHLLWQLLMTRPDPEEERIGSLIIGNLDKDGFLKTSVSELAQMAQTSEAAVETVLTLMQGFDPVGVCTRGLRECLLLQCRLLGLEDSVVSAIIADHLVNLENKNYKAIAKSLKVEIEEVIQAVGIIRGLEPRPGREFSQDPPHYITPDIYVHQIEDEFVIVLNDDGLPKIRVSSFYQKAIGSDGQLTGNAREYMQEKLRSASWLIKSIQQRQKTIYKVMESILKYQQEFFQKGVAHLKPMVLRDVAEDIGMHESTISRVTSNKYAYTPQGIFELKYFFNSSINRDFGEAMASASVQERIRRLIESEDPQKPYSDEKISQMLKAADINIARRTVAKYREMMRILPSSKRKQI